METVKSWSGELKYLSELGNGTRAIITLPRSKPPEWFLNTICINEGANVIILDDDKDMHRLWMDKLNAAGVSSDRVLSFCCSKDLIRWYRNSLGTADQCVYLCDLELSSDDCTGLDVIEMLGIAANAILLTNGLDDPEVKSRCKKTGVKILPKLITLSIRIKERQFA
jgi:hypothetical protein